MQYQKKQPQRGQRVVITTAHDVSSDDNDDAEGDTRSDTYSDTAPPYSSDDDDDDPPKGPNGPTEGAPFDMRDAFGIDEKDPHSARVLALISFTMQKLNRQLTDTEQMSYIYTWMTLGMSLLQVNISEYGALKMTYAMPDGQLESSCYRAEIIGRLHNACYETFLQAIDYVHGLLYGASIHPLILTTPIVRATPLNHATLCHMLQTQVEMCQIAVTHFHRTWEDFSHGFTECEPCGALAMAQMSSAHTATLGVIGSHLVQVIQTLQGGVERLKDLYIRWLWQSAVVVYSAQALLPLHDSDRNRVSIRLFASQLKLVVYRHLVTGFAERTDWARAAYFTNRILKVLGTYADSPDDRKALQIYQQKCVAHYVSYIPPEDSAPMADLEKHREDLKISDAHISTFAGGAVSTVYAQRVLARRIITHFEPLILRLRGTPARYQKMAVTRIG